MPRQTNRLIAYLRARQARATLMSFDDRMLADIGVSRSEIDRVVSRREAL